MTPAHPPPDVRLEPDRFRAGPALAVLAAIVGVFLLAVFWAWRLQRAVESGRETTMVTATPPAHAFQYEVGLSNQQPFDVERRAEQLQSAQRQGLERYGWSDRARQTVNAPVGFGIQRLLQGNGGRSTP
jgi:hypothetical protein